MIEIPNFPKIQCPFVRKEFEVNKEDWYRYGKRFQLRSPKIYLAIDEIIQDMNGYLDIQM